MEIQSVISQWLSQIAAYLPFGYAFGAGMVSAVNPCGFFMLPVYLSLYLGAEESDFRQHSLLRRIIRAVWVSLMVTLGFGLLFGLVGALVSAGGFFLMGIMPWFAIFVGLCLLLLGWWILLGHSLSFPLVHRLAKKIGDPRDMSTRGFFLYGMAFGATSLSCTLPIFLALVGSSVTAGNFSAGLVQFLFYILGMGAVLLSLTLSIAMLKKQLIVGALRRLMPHSQKISAFFLLVAGGYIMYYWLSSGLLFGS
jgi:cytochrome c-type biogenesis protein